MLLPAKGKRKMAAAGQSTQLLTAGTPSLNRSGLLPMLGKIAGCFDVVDYTEDSNSPWFAGEPGIALANPRILPAVLPCRGAIGHFIVDQDIPDLGDELALPDTLNQANPVPYSLPATDKHTMRIHG